MGEGGLGDDTIIAGPGNSTSDGGDGTDLLNGGILADSFIFSADTPGQDAVAYIEAWDQLEFLDFGYSNADPACSNMAQAGEDVIFADQGVVVTFNIATLAEIEALNILV